ncbi:hypothetical protein [Streptacidiphilus sp. PAMC 29251]
MGVGTATMSGAVAVLLGRQSTLGTSNSLGRFLYWSERAVRQFAEDNGVELEARLKRQVSVSVPGIAQAVVGNSDRRTRDLLEETRRIEKKIGADALKVLDRPPPAAFVKAVGRVNFAEFHGSYAHNKGALVHLKTHSDTGQRVDLCLFGSMDNVRGYGKLDHFVDGWFSSAWYAIEELLNSHGQRNTSQWDDSESRSVEALKIALEHGTSRATQAGRPETRGFTVGHAEDCELMAEVYTDVILTPSRWNWTSQDGELAEAQRIIVGRPLWVRTATPEAVVRYAELRNGPYWARWSRLMKVDRFVRRRFARLPLVRHNPAPLPPPQVAELDPPPAGRSA